MSSLLDRFCPSVHDAPITAAAFDPFSGVAATGDANGIIAVTRARENTPGLVLQHGPDPISALGLVRGGSLLAIGDEGGTISVLRTDTGRLVFQETRGGARGRVRAMRGVAIHPDGSQIASISIDGILRIWDLERGERRVAWQGFGGRSVEYDARGTRLLSLNESGQIRLVDLVSNQGMPVDRLQVPADIASFTLDGTRILAAGASGISLFQVADGVLVSSFAARGGSGILNLVQSPDGRKVGAVSQRSVHVFSLPDLQPLESSRHGAPEPSGAAWWSNQGIRVAGRDGLMHSGGKGSAGAVSLASGFGNFRLAVHGDRVAIWEENRRASEIATKGGAIREVHIDRDGQHIVVLPDRGPIEVFDRVSGQRIFDGGPQTIGAQAVAVGGPVVAALLAQGGVRWWNLANGRAFELGWPQNMALSHGGTWLGVVTPKGLVKILDPATGADAVTDPQLPPNVRAIHLGFINRRPDLLMVDSDNILSLFQLTGSVMDGRPASGRDILQFQTRPDQVWGITGGAYAALRFPDGPHATILFIDLQNPAVVHEVTGLHPRAWVDAETGCILEPGRGAALLEREMDGQEARVLRALPDEQWVAFGPRGIFDASPGFGDVLGA